MWNTWPRRALLAAAAVAVVGSIAFVVIWNTDGTPVGAGGGAVRSPDGRTTVTVPPGVADRGSAMRIDDAPSETDEVRRSGLGIVPLATAVNVRVRRGHVRGGTITLTYDPRRLPTGATPAQVGIVVLDTALGGWVPLFDARADPVTNTVSASVPHFSVFAVVSLNPLHELARFGGRQIKAGIEMASSVPGRVADLAGRLAVEFLHSLLAIPDDLECNPPSTTLRATASAAVPGALQACVQQSGNDGVLRLRNHYGFPIRLDVPAGLHADARDLVEGNRDLVNLIQNTVWAGHDQVVVGGAELSALTVTPAMTSSARLTGRMDNASVIFDVALAGLFVLVPEEEALKPVLTNALRSAAAAPAFAAALNAELRKAAAQVPRIGLVLDLGDCAVASGNTIAVPGPPNLMARLAEAGYDCLGAALHVPANVKLKDILADAVSLVGLVPETLESGLAAAVQDVTLGKVDLTKVSVTVERHGDLGPYVGYWYSHSVVLTVKADGTAELDWQPLDASCHPAVDCWQQAAITVQAGSGGATGRIVTSRHPKDFAPGLTFDLELLPGQRLKVLGFTLCGPDPAARGLCGA